MSKIICICLHLISENKKLIKKKSEFISSEEYNINAVISNKDFH